MASFPQIFGLTETDWAVCDAKRPAHWAVQVSINEKLRILLGRHSLNHMSRWQHTPKQAEDYCQGGKYRGGNQTGFCHGSQMVFDPTPLVRLAEKSLLCDFELRIRNDPFSPEIIELCQISIQITRLLGSACRMDFS